MLRPAVAQERVEPRPEGLVRITLKNAYADGTIAVDMDPPSLLCRPRLGSAGPGEPVEKGPGADGTLRDTRGRPEAARPEGAPS